MSEGFYSRLASFVLRRRWPVLASYCLLTAALAWLSTFITLRADITDLLPEGTASGDDLRFYLKRFGNTYPLFFSLKGSDPEEIEAFEEAASILSAELTATRMFRSVRYGFSEDEALQVARRAMAHLPVLVPAYRMDELAEKAAPESILRAVQRLRSGATGPLMAGPRKTLAAEDPLGLLALVSSTGAGAGGPALIDPASGLFLSHDGASLLIIATPITQPQDVAFSRKLLEAVAGVQARMARQAPDITLDYAGGHLFAVQDEARIRHDITWTVSISMASILLLFAVVLRRIGLLLILVVPLTLSTLWTLGIASIYPGHLNLVTVAFAAILLGMGDDSITHLYLRFREETSAGLARDDALRAAMVSTGPSILVATLTSGLAFAALTFVEFRGLAELGVIAAIGLLNLLVSVFFLFPCLLSFGSAGTAARSVGSAVLQAPMELVVSFHRWGMRHRAPVLTLAALITAAAGLASLKLEFSSDYKALRGSDPAQEKLERVLAPFSGLPDPIHLIQEAASPEEALQSAEAQLLVCRTLQEEGLIAGFSSVASWLPSQASQRSSFEQASRIPWDDVSRRFRESAEEIGLNAGFFAPFFANLDRYSRWEEVRIPPEEAQAVEGIGSGLAGSAVATSIYPAPGQPPGRILERARQIDPRAASRAASVSLVLADLTAIVQNDFRRASLIALCAVLLTTLAAFRTPSRLLLVATPVVVGCLLMLAGLALLGVPINLMNLVATPLVFGLGIDFGVYLVNRHEEEGGADVPKVLRHTGGAILLTGLTTLAGFGSLLAAEFAGLRSMGWVAVLGIGGCLLASLFILPLLLPRSSK